MWLVSDILREGSERFKDKLALKDPNGEVTYDQLSTTSWIIGNSLIDAGVRPGDRVVLVLPNSVRFAQAHFGALSCGAVSVPCDSAITADNLKRISGNCEPRTLITDASFVSRIPPGFLSDIFEKVFVFGGIKSLPSLLQYVCLDSLLDGSCSGIIPDVKIDPRNVATLMYTTGTTGRAKGVPLTHLNINAAITNILNFVGYSESDKEVIILPLSHNFGLGHLYCNLLSGGAVYTENGMARVGRVLKQLSAWGATGFPGTPTGFGILIDKYSDVLREHGQNLRFSVINSAPLPPKRTKQLQEILPNLDIMVYYGLTEASRSTFISLSREGEKYYGSVGSSMSGVQIDLVDTDGEHVGTGRSGEVVISGPTVTHGYWKNEELNRVSFKDGKLYTGDLGYKCERGFLFLTGRKKDFINVGGYKVNPLEVEEVVVAFKGIGDVGVVGISDFKGITGESVVACFVSESGGLDMDALETHCVKQLEKFKVPVAFESVKSIPRTTTGKVRRHELIGLVQKRHQKGEK
ncbi:acyl--CoA ligase [Verrucomicrobia bacterium]|nr:acyl--CoA ligase [Verrucomicrobiota bacterium]